MLSYEHILQFIAVLTGLLCWKKLITVHLRLLVLLVAVTWFNESFIIPLMIKYEKQDFDYNVFSIIDMLYWFFIFYKLYQHTKAVNQIFVLAGLSFLFSAVELFGYKGWQHLHIDSFRFYSICIIYLAVKYLYQIIKIDKYYNLFNDYGFFVCAACLIYQSMLFIIFSTLSENSFWQFKEADYVYNLLQVITNIIYYTLLCAAFITASLNKQYYKSAFLT